VYGSEVSRFLLDLMALLGDPVNMLLQ
jgi:hypothetical protein